MLIKSQISEIVDMALCDETPFDGIEAVYGLKESAVMRLMQSNLKPGSYRAWRKRVRTFRNRREVYKNQN